MVPKVSARRSRPVLSRDVIAHVALRLTLEQPATPLTLARLGAELGADPTALYRHYRSRDESVARPGRSSVHRTERSVPAR